jgi:hypothetical protein
MFVLLLLFRVDQDVIEVYNTDWIDKVAKGLIDVYLKGRRYVSKAERHNHVFE